MPWLGSVTVMASQLGETGVTITRTAGGDPGPVAGGPTVGVLVRNNVLKVTRRGALLLEVDGVVAVEHPTRKTWTVTTAAGDVFDVAKLAGCGCGGGR